MPIPVIDMAVMMRNLSSLKEERVEAAKLYKSELKRTDIPKDEFESILEWHADQERKYLVGIIHFSKLRENDWWKRNNVSLILTPDPIIESMEIRDLKKRSLELAGIM